MMNFSMNYRKRAPMGIIQVAQVIDNVRSMPLQVARVPVVKAVDSYITKPIKKDESYEVRENIGNTENTEKEIIIYNIGNQEEKHEECESIPVPVLEEPVIETLSSVVVPVSTLLPSIREEQSKEDDDHQHSIEEVQQLHDDVKKKKRRMKGMRK
jgi:hypothetical protein